MLDLVWVQRLVLCQEQKQLLSGCAGFTPTQLSLIHSVENLTIETSLLTSISIIISLRFYHSPQNLTSCNHLLVFPTAGGLL